MDPRINEFFKKDTLASVQEWLVQLTYWYGWLQGLKVSPEKQASGHISLFDYMLQSELLEYRWYRNSGRMYLTIYEQAARYSGDGHNLSSITWAGKSLNHLLVFGHGAIGDNSPQFIVDIVEAIEQKIRSFFPQIHALNSFRICSIPIHILEFRRNELHIASEPVLSLCNQVGEQWLCTECVERFDLNPDNFTSPPTLNKKQQAEMARLKPELRLSILQRDRFTCAVCQRSPFNGDNVQMTVSHRVPVKDGGKTMAENLVTVCRGCMGKQADSK